MEANMLILGGYILSSVYSYHTINKMDNEINNRAKEKYNLYLKNNLGSEVKKIVFSAIPGINLLGALCINLFKNEIYNIADEKAAIKALEVERNSIKYEMTSDDQNNNNKVKIEIRGKSLEENDKIKEQLNKYKDVLLSIKSDEEVSKQEEQNNVKGLKPRK